MSGTVPAPTVRPGVAAPGPTIAFVATANSIPNWPERRLYEPLSADFAIHAIYWERGAPMDDWAYARAERFRVRLHPFRRPWGLASLIHYHRFIVRELDRIRAAGGLDVVIAADPDVLPAVIWHRLTRHLQYRIVRNEVDHYGGSRGPGAGLADRAKRIAFDTLEAILHTQCDAVITLNRYSKARLVHWGVPARKIVVAGLWKPDEYFVADRESHKRVLVDKGILRPDQYDRIQDRVVISFLGLFYRHTHLPELLEVVKDYPDDFAVVLAGKGPEQPVVERFCATYANLLFLGWRSEDEVRDIAKITDIVYQPLNPADNANWRTFGSTNKMCEALAAGCLFIGSAINERVDLNAEAEFAVQIDFRRDVATQLHELLGAILADREVLTRRQRNARRLFERYSHAAFVERVRPLFEGLRPSAKQATVANRRN